MDLFEDTYSEEYRFKCELKYISQMNLSERRKYIVLVGEKRGMKARQEIENGLILFWNNRKLNNAKESK